MNVYKDLTYYSDVRFENAINIGWVHPETNFENTETDYELIESLLPYLSFRFNQTRGGHYLKDINILGKDYLFGYSEIRIISHDFKRKYAVADTIFCAIIEQGYRPPQVFIDDLMSAIPPDSDEYQTYYKNYHRDSMLGKSNDFWGESEEYINLINEMINLIATDNQSILIKKINQDNQLLNLVTHEGSLLNAAIRNNKINIALWLIDNGIDINKFNGIELLTAIEMQQKEVVDTLIDKNIMYQVYQRAVNPLICAIRHHNLDAIKKLLDSGYDVFRTYNDAYVRNYTIADCVNQSGNQEVKDFFKEHLDLYEKIC